MALYERARPDGTWRDLPDTSTPIEAVHVERWENALYDLKRREINAAADFGASTTASGADNSAAFNEAIQALSDAGGGVVLPPPGGYAVTNTIQMRSRVVFGGVRSVHGIWGYDASPQNYVTTYLIASGGSGPVIQSGTSVFHAGVRNLAVFPQGRDGVSFTHTTNRLGNELVRMYVNGGATNIYVGAAETRMRSVLSMLATGDGMQVDGLDCTLVDFLSGFNGGWGAVVGSTGAQNANVLRADLWDIFDNLEGVQWNGDGHRGGLIEVNNNMRRGNVFLTCTGAAIAQLVAGDNGREYDGATHLTRYADVAFAHPTAGNTGCHINGGRIYSSDGKQSNAVQCAETVTTFPGISGVAFAGSYAGGSAPSDYVSSPSSVQTRGCTGVPDMCVPQGGSPAIRTRPNGSADQFQATDGSGGAWAGFKNNGAFYQRHVALIYGVAVATDASTGNAFDITATNGTAFTISNPTSLTDGQIVTYTIRNTSGGALGVATWGATFKLAAWTQPANGFSRSITFRYDATTLVEVSRTPADVPN